ncbi:MAG: hypothetical protein ACXVKA_05845 [Acidimicrobiia bacterium]
MDSAPRCLRAPVALICAVMAISLVACSGGSEAKAKAAAPEGSTLKLTAGDVQVEAAGTPGTLSVADKDAIIETLRKYVIAATINPLNGKKVGNLTSVFTSEGAASLTGPNRDAAVDEGMPKSTGTVKAVAPPVPLVALSDPTGAIDLVGATLFLDVHAKASGGPVRVLRTGELVVQRDAGAWKIASYKLSVNRSGSGIPTPTSSSSTP